MDEPTPILARRWHRLLRGNMVRVRPGCAWRTAPWLSEARPIFVGGCGRSGTTLLRVILNSHPHIACGVESKLIQPRSIKPRDLEQKFDVPRAECARLLDGSRSQAEFTERFLSLYAQRCGKVRWADKTPDNIRHMDYVFEHFPNSRFIHIIRDGRDVMCSLRTHPSHTMVNGKKVALHTWNPLDTCIQRWTETVSLGLALRSDERCHEVRYEDLLVDGERVLRDLFDFLEEPWSDQVLEYYRRDDASHDDAKNPLHPGIKQPLNQRSVQRWRRDLSREEACQVHRQAGALLAELGYIQDARWVQECAEYPAGRTIPR